MTTDNTSERDDGGPAFPRLQQIDRFENIVVEEAPGMSLRDAAAIAVLQGLMANPERYRYIAAQVECGAISQDEATEKNVRKALRIADAYIKARNQ